MAPVAQSTRAVVPPGSGADRDDGRVKIAIVGTGLAGLHANHLLGRQSDRYDVHLFEQNTALGLDASSITLDDGVRIDVPMRSINSGYYPNLVRLYRSLGVRLRKSDFTFSFAVSHAPRQPFLLYNGMSGLRGISMPVMGGAGTGRRPSLPRRAMAYAVHARLCLSFVVSYICLLLLAIYHHALGHLLDPNHPLSREPMARWTGRHPRVLHPAFVHAVLFSLFSAVGTSSYEAVEQMPAAELLLYVAATFLRSHYVVRDGVQAVQASLIADTNAGQSNVHLASTVQHLEHEGHTGLATIRYSSHGDRQHAITGFHHVILACPATLSASLLQSYSRSLKSAGKLASASQHADQLSNVQGMQRTLSHVRYETSTVINHTDLSLLPSDPANRRELNIVCPSQISCDPFDQGVKNGSGGSAGATQACSTATHVVRIASSSAAATLLQTTNPSVRPAADKIISEATFLRAITPPSKKALEGLYVWRSDWVPLLHRLRALFLLDTRGPMLRSDWISASLEVLTGRRWTQSLGPYHEAQIRKDGPAVRFWACGSYAHGIPLLEGCVTSSTLVVDGIARCHGSTTPMCCE